MKRYKKNKFLPLILLLFLAMTIGFAYLRTSLSINGRANFKENSWNIYFDNVQIKNGSVTPVTAPTIPSNDKTTVSFEVNLNNIGDFYEFTIDVVNDGTIDAMVDSFTFSPELTDAQKKYIEYDVTYSNGSEIKVHDLLRAGSSETLGVRIKYRNDLNPEDLPNIPDEVEPTVTIVYVQATDEAEEVINVMAVLRTPTVSCYEICFIEDDDFRRYSSDIKTISFEKGINEPMDAFGSWDIGVAQNGNVMSYLVANPDDDTMYDLYIQSDIQLYANEDMSYWFFGMNKLESINGLELVDMSFTTDMSYMFSCVGSSVESFSLDLSDLDTSNVINMERMFAGAGSYALNFDLDISNWDVSNVTDMSYMFSDAGSDVESFNLDLSGWNASNVISMERMFDDTGRNSRKYNLNLSNWDTSNLTNMSFMFRHAGYNATIWDIGDLSSWDTSKVTTMQQAFYEAGYKVEEFKIKGLNNWNLTSAVNIGSMFSHAGYNATVWDIGNLSNWNLSNVIDVSGMFNHAGYNATFFDISYVENWDISNVIDMGGMFICAGYNATIWNIGDLSNWDTSKVLDMSEMFKGAGYNASTWSVGDLSNWDTSNVTNMAWTFWDAGYNATTKVSPNVSTWNVSKVKDHSVFNVAWITPPTWIN